MTLASLKAKARLASMYTQQQIEDRIKQIDSDLLAGIGSVTVGDTTTSANLAQLRKERKELYRQLRAIKSPVSMRVNLRHG